MDIHVIENEIVLDIHITEDKDVRLMHLGSKESEIKVAEEIASKFRLVEVHETGRNQNDHHGSKHTGSNPGYLLKYYDHKDYKNNFGRKLEIIQVYEGLYVTSHIQFYTDIKVIRCWSTLSNQSEEIRPIEYVSSFALTGLSKESSLRRDEGSKIYIPHNTWYGETQWKSYTLNELGYDVVNDFSMKRISLSNTGSWATSEHLAMGSYNHFVCNETLTWQIETSGSWHWEISDIGRELYLQLSGPTYQENHFLKELRPQEVFESVPCAIAVVQGDFEASIRELTKYRRRIRRQNEDNAHPKVIFNDYMNCLMGDPTTQKLLPLIDAAAEVGCEYFCIDAGWYAPGYWWDGVGEWLPSRERFPNGIEEPIKYIREKGMIPGLWLELEVMGIQCPLTKKVSSDWFFKRNGKAIIDEGRYQLDFRNAQVRHHADEVVKRVVEEYGVGYIKMDYNINIGAGTEVDADSAGDGLLQHTRAYHKWLDGLFEKYPDLVIENCSSGGMRMEYSLLSRQSIQSVTDQTDYKKMAAIAANCMTAVTPEQAAIWSYPLEDGDEEEVIFNMVNAILLRIHQSGHLAHIRPERLEYVKEGIAYHKQINKVLKEGLPIWPLGLASFLDDVMAVGIEHGKKIYLAVWKVKGAEEKLEIPIAKLSGKDVQVKCSYPSQAEVPLKWVEEQGVLEVEMAACTARIFEMEWS